MTLTFKWHRAADTLECVPGTEFQTVAWVDSIGGRKGVIHICRSSWRDMTYGQRCHAVLHEAGHDWMGRFHSSRPPMQPAIPAPNRVVRTCRRWRPRPPHRLPDPAPTTFESWG